MIHGYPTRIENLDSVEYPEGDGRRMAESDIHFHWMVRVNTILKWRYRDEKVYVSGNLLVYYKEGMPEGCVAPDCFVVFDCKPRDRATFKTWEELRWPSVAFEITSADTQIEDVNEKPRRFAELGVKEYFVFDPLSEYLSPRLIGFRMVDQSYVEIEPNANHELVSEELGIVLELKDNELVLRDRLTGEVLLTDAEHYKAAANRRAHDFLIAEKQIEAAAMQDEINQLRDQLRKEQGGE